MGAAASTSGRQNSQVIKKFSQTYMLARELGSGAFSVVKLGVHLETGRKTAVKVVSKKKLSEEDYAALLMEIQILQELDHPHIIKYVAYDCLTLSKRWTAEQLLKHAWITMGDENLVGKDLSSSITVMRKFNARRRLKAAADAVIMANRMNRLLGGLRGAAAASQGGAVVDTADKVIDEPGVIGKKKISLIDPDALGSTEHEAEEFNQLRTRMSFDSDIYGDAPSINPALDLLNDKELEGI
eukprot:gene30466-36823_t